MTQNRASGWTLLGMSMAVLLAASSPTQAQCRYSYSCGPTTTGTAGNDTLFGGATDDCIFGLAGNDTIGGAGGTDYLDGGDGDDNLDGGNGNDLLDGWNGNDTLNGAAATTISGLVR